MIFKQIDEILNGTKTQTRRIRKIGEWQDFHYGVHHKDRLKWAVGRTYAIVPKRGQFAIKSHRIKIVGIRLDFLQSITQSDARAEGVSDISEYKELWERINGKGSWNKDTMVWVIDFECIEVKS